MKTSTLVLLGVAGFVLYKMRASPVATAPTGYQYRATIAPDGAFPVPGLMPMPGLVELPGGIFTDGSRDWRGDILRIAI